MPLRLFALLTIFSGSACTGPENSQAPIDSSISDKRVEIETKQFSLSYNLVEPDNTFYLDNDLIEISGLTYADSELYAINDEKGNIYAINQESGESKKILDFAKDGDYEGIAHTNNQLIVLKSNGHLYFPDDDSGSTEERKTELKQENDAEGICFDPISNSLLIACKGSPIESDKSKDQKAIYSYDLGKQKLKKKPHFIIHDQHLTEKVENDQTSVSKSTLKQLKSRTKAFAPSGIAYNPIDEYYYMVSARGSLLVVLNNAGDLLEVAFLNPKTIPQPEGICFDNQGTMYISTEGNNAKAKLMTYKRL